MPQPVVAVPAFLLVSVFQPRLPASVGFAGGAMIFLVISELLPESFESSSTTESAWGTAIGLIGMLGSIAAIGFQEARYFPRGMRNSSHIRPSANVRATEFPVISSTFLWAHRGTCVATGGGVGADIISPISLRERLRVHETRLIRWALKQTGGNRSRAAALLQVKRSTLGDRIKRCGLDADRNGGSHGQPHC